MSKFIKISTFLLTFIIIVELLIIFFIYYGNNFSNYFIKTKIEEKRVKNECPISLSWENPRKYDYNFYLINPNIAIDGKVLMELTLYKKQLLKNTLIKNIHEGVVKEVIKGPHPAFYDYFQYKLRIVISDIKENNINHYFELSENDMSNAKFYILNKDGKKEETTFESIKKGDFLRIEDYIEGTKTIPIQERDKNYYFTKSWGFNRIKIEIIKLNYKL